MAGAPGQERRNMSDNTPVQVKIVLGGQPHSDETADAVFAVTFSEDEKGIEGKASIVGKYTTDAALKMMSGLIDVIAFELGTCREAVLFNLVLLGEEQRCA